MTNQPKETENEYYIITCKCKGTASFAKTTHTLYYPNSPVPTLIEGKRQISQLAERKGYANTNFGKYLQGLSSGRTKFAYYFEVAPDGTIVECRDLQTGKRVA